MSQMTTPGGMSAQRSADNDVYTVLMLVATLFSLTATIYIAYRAAAFFGSVLPPGGS